MCDRNAAQIYKRLSLKDALDSCFSSQTAEMVLTKQLQQLSHKPWQNWSFQSYFWSQATFLHPYLASSHKSLPSLGSSGDRAMPPWQSCHIQVVQDGDNLTVSCLLLESLCRTPVQSTKYSQTAHLLYSSGSLEMLQACIQVLMQWDLYICPTPKKKKKP